MSLYALSFLELSSFSYKSTGISYTPALFCELTYLLNVLTFFFNSEAEDDSAISGQRTRKASLKYHGMSSRLSRIDARQSPSWLPHTKPHSEVTNSSSPTQEPSLALSLCWFLHPNYSLFSSHSHSRYLCASLVAWRLSIIPYNLSCSYLPVSSQLIETMTDLYVHCSSFSGIFDHDPEKDMHFTLSSSTYRSTCTRTLSYAQLKQKFSQTLLTLPT